MKKKATIILIIFLLIMPILPTTVFADTKVKDENTEKTSMLYDIEITTPQEGNLYAMGAQIFNLPFGWTIIVGPITIRADISGINGFEVEFYIDGVKKMTDDSPPFEYPWWDFTFGRHTVEVQLYSEDTLRDTDSIQLFKIF